MAGTVLLFVIVSVDSELLEEQVPFVPFTDPVIVVPVALHASLLSVVKPIFSSLSPLTAVSAAKAVMEKTGMSEKTSTNTSIRDVKRFKICLIILVSSPNFFRFCLKFIIGTQADGKGNNTPDMGKVEDAKTGCILLAEPLQ